MIDVTPFDERHVATYINQCRGERASASEVAAILTATGGNPLYVAELVRQPSVGNGTRQSALRRLLRRRVTELEPCERRVLGAAAILGDGATVTEVASVVGDPTADVETIVNLRAADAELVDHEIRFSHALIRDALVASMSPVRRQRLHAAAASAIRGSDVCHAVRRAHHRVEAAALSPDDHRAAVDACLEVATQLHGAWEFEQAADWAVRGLCRWTQVRHRRPSRRWLILAHADAVLACGRLAEARQLFEAAAEPAERAGDPRLLASAALGFGGVWVEEQRDEISRRRMLALCERAVTTLGPDEPALVGNPWRPSRR